MHELLNKPLERSIPFIFLQVTFPHGNDSPAVSFQLSTAFSVLGLVAVDLVQPPLGAGLGNNKVSAPLMAMPEATVNEDHRVVLFQDDVRLSRQVLIMQPVTETVGVKKPAHEHFRFRVLAPDPAHVV